MITEAKYTESGSIVSEVPKRTLSAVVLTPGYGTRTLELTEIGSSGFRIFSDSSRDLLDWTADAET